MAVVVAVLGRLVRPDGRRGDHGHRQRAFPWGRTIVEISLADFAEQVGLTCSNIWKLAKGKGYSSQQMARFGRREMRKRVYRRVRGNGSRSELNPLRSLFFQVFLASALSRSNVNSSRNCEPLEIRTHWGPDDQSRRSYSRDSRDEHSSRQQSWSSPIQFFLRTALRLPPKIEVWRCILGNVFNRPMLRRNFRMTELARPRFPKTSRLNRPAFSMPSCRRSSRVPPIGLWKMANGTFLQR